MMNQCLKMMGRVAVATIAMMVTTEVARSAGWQNTKENDEKALPGNNIQFLKSVNGGIWIGGLEGLTFFDGKKFTAVKKGEKELKRKIWGVLKVKDSWLVGQRRGVSIVKDLKVLKEVDNLSGEVWPILKGKGGAVWAMGRNGGTSLYRIVGGKAENLASELEQLDIKKPDPEDLFCTKDGVFWVTIAGNGIVEADPTLSPDEWKHHLNGFNVTYVNEMADGKIWCGLWERGVAWYDGGLWNRQLKVEDMVTLKIVGDAEGKNVWVASNDRGLFRYDGKEWKQYKKEEGAINLLKVTKDGTVWLSSQEVGGLQKWNGEEWEVMIPGPFPIRDVIYSKKHGVWAGGILDGLHIWEK